MSGYRHDATGRSSSKRHRSVKLKVNPPPDQPWIWLATEIMGSPAWRALGINARQLIDRLIIEHRPHAGLENGQLKCTHADLIDYGLSKNKVKDAIDEARILGFVRVVQGGRYACGRDPNLYRLTFYGDHEGAYPTNEWKGMSEEVIKAWQRQRREEGRKRRIARQPKTDKTPTSGNGQPPQVRVLRHGSGR